MTILYEDKELLIVDKPAKMLTIATDKEKERTLYHEASSYVKKQYPKNKVFIVNRLDKDTSGIVVFAKNQEMKQLLQKNWNQLAVKREYVAIVEGCVLKKKDVLKSYLVEDKTLKVHSTTTSKGSLAITKYETLAKTKSYSFLRITILTGKKNQIRVQLSDLGHPIIGDKKYGACKNPIRRMGLHAAVLQLNVSSKKIIKCYAKVPKEFRQLFEKEALEYEKNIND